MSLESRTRATLRSAEFGFFGVVVYTRVHTPRRCGLPFSAAVLVFATLSSRPLRTSCWMVGMDQLSSVFWRWGSVSYCSSGYCSSGAVVLYRSPVGALRGRSLRTPRSGVSLLDPADCQNRFRLERGGTLTRPEARDPV